MSATESLARAPLSQTLLVRGLACHVTRWPGDAADPTVLLHGNLDCGATFQFLADQLPARFTLVAPDWRGFGLSGWARDGYWFADYYADLDVLLQQLAPDRPVDLIGHSMGGNIAMIYAGIRPERVRRVVCLEGFGLPRTGSAQAPGRLREWLQQLSTPHMLQPTIFPSVEQLAGVLRRKNLRLSAERALFVAAAWAQALPDGRARLRFDPAHKRVNPILYRRDEAEACWREIRAPVLYVDGSESEFAARFDGEASAASMRRFIPQLQARTIAAAGHMLHHDQPEQLAQAIVDFLNEGDART